jgi:hypothetical protein
MAESDKFFAMSFNHFRRVQADEGPIVLQLVNPPPPCIPEGQLSVEVCSDEYEDTSNMLLGKLSSSDVLGDGGCEQDDTEGEDVVADEEAVGEAPGTEEAVADEEAAFISEGETEDESDMDTSDMLLGKLLADRLASPSQPSSPIVVAARSKRSSPCTPPGGPKQLELGTKATSAGPQLPSKARPPAPPTRRLVPTPPSVPPPSHRVPPRPPSRVSTTWATAPPPTPPPSLVQRQQPASSSSGAAASSSSTAAGDRSSTTWATAPPPTPPPKRHQLEELVDDSGATTTGLGKCGPWREGIHGGRQRFGSSGGTHREYYQGFYRAKGQGKGALAAYIEWMGPPPSRWD